MNRRVLHTLEYSEIIGHLASFAGSERGRRLCRELCPMKDRREIEEALQETKDALSRLLKSSRVSFSGIREILPSLRRMEIGSSLNAEELLSIASLLEETQHMLSFAKATGNEESRDSLSAYFSMLDSLPHLLSEIRRCILSPEEIADDASPVLKDLRRKIRSMDGRIHGQMASLLNSAELRDHLQDSVITMKEGRYCLPVKASSKSQVPGMIQGHSGSGSTLFIEPLAVVNLNNELKELLLREEEEIAKILASLTASASKDTETIRRNYDTLTFLDFVFAKASLALEQNGSVPLLNERGLIRLRKARHPLLPVQTAVPIDVTLGDTYDQLIITGPNTGGKTVSLKTVGLLTLMGLSGLLIPSGDRSELSVFTEVYADIGDEQSIEQSLSTFSAHTKNIVYILKHVDRRSLVLFDELCAGTDPVEGAALAAAILSELHGRGIRTMATTHYSELKVYALTENGVENASCEFDISTLSPTYRLLTGIPGKSNAFAISGKLGLPKALIENAKHRINVQEKDFENVIVSLEESRKEAEEKQKQISVMHSEAQSLLSDAADKKEKLSRSRDRILREANEEAVRILREAKETADTAIRNIQKYGSSDSHIAEMESQRSALREEIHRFEDKIPDKKKPKEHKAPKSVQPGDRVRVVSMNLTGTVHTPPNSKGDLTVQMGILSSIVNIRDLELLPDEKTETERKYRSSGSGKIKMSKTASVGTEINLIGKTTDEAIAELDKYLDDAYLAHIPSVRIVHGKGTGALRNAVQQHLRKLSYIADFHLGEYGEGDAGVTIAAFKNE